MGFWKLKDREKRAAELYEQGWSASQIAKEIAKTCERHEAAPSRNAVMGVIHRMAVHNRGKASAPPGKRRNPAQRAAAAGTVPNELPRPQNLPKRAKAPPPEPGFEPAPKETFVARSRPPGGGALPPRARPPSRPEAATGVQLEDLKFGMCKWPIGDPLSPGFCFCARTIESQEADAPYCDRHRRIAYQPPPIRRPKGNDLAKTLRRYL